VLTYLGGGPLLTVLRVLSKKTNTTVTTITTITTCGVQQFSAVSRGYNGGARFPPSTVVSCYSSTVGKLNLSTGVRGSQTQGSGNQLLQSPAYMIWVRSMLHLASNSKQIKLIMLRGATLEELKMSTSRGIPHAGVGEPPPAYPFWVNRMLPPASNSKQI
jgi:hypothetical protein